MYTQLASVNANQPLVPIESRLPAAAASPGSLWSVRNGRNGLAALSAALCQKGGLHVHVRQSSN